MQPASARRSSLPVLGQQSLLAATATPTFNTTSAIDPGSADSEVMVLPTSPLVPRRPDSARRQTRPRPDAARSKSAEESVIRPFHSHDGNAEDNDDTTLRPGSSLSATRPFSGRRNRTSDPENAPVQIDITSESILEHTAVASPGRIRASKVPHLLSSPNSPPVANHAPFPPANRVAGNSGDEFDMDEIPYTRRDSEEESAKLPPSPLSALKPASVRPASPRPLPRRGASSASRSPVEKTGILGDQTCGQPGHVEEDHCMQHSQPEVLERRPSKGSFRMRRGGDSPLGALSAAVDLIDPESGHSGSPLNQSGSPLASELAYVRPSTSRLLSTGVGRRSSLPEPLSAPRGDDGDASRPDLRDEALGRWLSPDSPSASPMPMLPSADSNASPPSSPPPSPMPGRRRRPTSAKRVEDRAVSELREGASPWDKLQLDSRMASTDVETDTGPSPPPSPMPGRRRRPTSAKRVEDRAVSELREGASPSDKLQLDSSTASTDVETDTGPPSSPFRSIRAEARESFTRGGSDLAVDVTHGSDGGWSVTLSPNEAAQEQRWSQGSSSTSGSGSSHAHGILHPTESPVADFLARNMASQKVLSQTSSREHEPSQAMTSPPPNTNRSNVVIDFKSLTLNSPPPEAAAGAHT